MRRGCGDINSWTGGKFQSDRGRADAFLSEPENGGGFKASGTKGRGTAWKGYIYRGKGKLQVPGGTRPGASGKEPVPVSGDALSGQAG